MSERADEAPLLLLDDVLSELDEERGSAFLAEVGDYEQAFVTATHVPLGLPGGEHGWHACATPSSMPVRCAEALARHGAVGARARAATDRWHCSRPPGARSSGPASRSNSHPARIVDGTLLVVTRSSAWSQQLSFLAEEILRLVAARAPHAAVERLRFRVGKLPTRGRVASVAEAAARRSTPRRLASSASSPREALERFRAGVERQGGPNVAAGWKECTSLRGARKSARGAALRVLSARRWRTSGRRPWRDCSPRRRGSASLERRH